MSDERIPDDLLAALKDPIARERLRRFFAIVNESDQRATEAKERASAEAPSGMSEPML
jgi:hypothetical protein